MKDWDIQKYEQLKKEYEELQKDYEELKIRYEELKNIIIWMRANYPDFCKQDDKFFWEKIWC